MLLDLSLLSFHAIVVLLVGSEEGNSIGATYFLVQLNEGIKGGEAQGTSGVEIKK